MAGADAAQWAFIPGSSQRAPGGNATLHYKDQRIELTYSSSVLGDFLTVMGQIQADFHRRSNRAHVSSIMHGDGWTGRSLHV
ncbi:hypothetical protein [Streptomyces sp. NPDC002889]|uniref:hypothetical protein n=1 Tax=Streptomyces sp. NPDC002889 TaxID=3364669 RepID=UPI0036CCAB37